MKALWIRVEAHAVDSIEVARFAEELGVDVLIAFAHYVTLGGAIAEHTPDGRIVDVPDAAIERWGRWTGKRGVFSPAVRTIFQNDAGEYDNWAESMGKLVERREKERKRKAPPVSKETPPPFRGNSVETPQPSPGNSGATGRNGTERDVTGRSAGSSSDQSSNRRNGDLDPESPRAHVSAEPAGPGSAPPADKPADALELPAAAIAFGALFYPRATTPKRRRQDIVRQLQALRSGGVSYKGTMVRAHSDERLAYHCEAVIREGVRIPDAAIVVLFAKLADTSDVSKARQQQEAADRIDEQRTTAHDVACAEAWLVDRPDVEAAIAEQLRAEGFAGSGELAETVGRMVRTSLLLAAWRAANNLQSPQP